MYTFGEPKTVQYKPFRELVWISFKNPDVTYSLDPFIVMLKKQLGLLIISE